MCQFVVVAARAIRCGAQTSGRLNWRINKWSERIVSAKLLNTCFLYTSVINSTKCMIIKKMFWVSVLWLLFTHIASFYHQNKKFLPGNNRDCEPKMRGAVPYNPTPSSSLSCVAGACVPFPDQIIMAQIHHASERIHHFLSRPMSLHL